METIINEIQYIKPDKKSFTILDVWYNNKFKVIPDGIIKGSKVHVDYILKDNKRYWQSVKLEQELPVTNKLPQETKVSKLTNELTSTDKNCILLCSKDLYLSEDNKRSFSECIDFIKELRLKI